MRQDDDSQSREQRSPAADDGRSRAARSNQPPHGGDRVPAVRRIAADQIEQRGGEQNDGVAEGPIHVMPSGWFERA